MAKHPAFAMLGISLVIMLIALDQTVVGTALPRMVSELQGFNLYPWVAASYLLTNATMIPVTGRLGDLYGRKPFMLFAILIFTIASILCGLSTSMLFLVIARGLQGLGGGMLVGCAFASVADLFPNLNDRVRWQVMLSSAFGIASALGPVLGGWMTEHLGWRSVFYVNLPFGIFALAIVWRYLPIIVHHQDKTSKGIDWWGVLFFIVTLASLLTLTEFGQQTTFNLLIFGALVALAILFGFIFFQHQRSSQAPLIPIHLLLNSQVRLFTCLAGLTGLNLFVLVFYIPLLLQAGFHLSPKEAGTLVTPILVCITVGSILNGRLISRISHPEKLYSAGVIILISGIIFTTLLTASSSKILLLSSFALCGFGLGFQLPNLIIQMQSAVAKTDLGTSSALIQSTRTLGSMFGASFAGLIVNIIFGQGVQSELKQQGITSSEILNLLKTPQILLSVENQNQLRTFTESHQFNMPMIIQTAQDSLIHGIHIALYCCVLIAILSAFLGLKIKNHLQHAKRTL